MNRDSTPSSFTRRSLRKLFFRAALTELSFWHLFSACMCIFFSEAVPAFSASTAVFRETQILTLENPPPIADLGYSVAASDGLLIAGAINVSTEKGDVGAAYIYQETGVGTWLQVAELVAEDGEHNDTFGYDVAIEGDFAVVGANNHEEESTGEGAAYFFLKESDSNWLQVAEILAPVNTRGFGSFLDISSSQAVVAGRKRGAPGAGNTRGFINIYEQFGHSDWTQVQQIDVGISSPNFLIRGLDLDDSTLVIGGQQNGTLDQASKYFVEVYEDSPDGFQLATTLESLSEPTNACCFGASVAIDNDRLLVGDPLDSEHGAVFMKWTPIIGPPA